MSSIGPAYSSSNCKDYTLRPRLAWWWFALCALLVVEVLVFSVRFDTGTLVHASSIWSDLLSRSSFLVNIGVSAIVALLVFGGNRIGPLLCDLAEHQNAEPIRWRALVAHLIAVLAFYSISQVLFREIQGASPSWVVFVGWISIGSVALALWMAAAAPITLWATIAHSIAKALAICVCLALVAFLVGRLANDFWRPLAQWTFSIVQTVLDPFYANVVADPARLVIGTEEFAVRIEPSCSGYEGVGLVAVFLGAYLWWFRARLRFPQSLVLLPLGIVLIWFLNAVRIAALIAVGNSVSVNVAAGGFHSQAGWLMFNAVTVGLIAIAANSRFFSRTAAEDRTASGTRAEFPAAPFLVPFLVLIATAMITSAVSAAGVDRFYGVRVLTTFAALAYFASVYRRLGLLSFSWSWSAVAIGAVVFVIWMALEPFAPLEHADRVAQTSALGGMSTFTAAMWILLRLIGSVLIVPVAEELAFRGFLIRRLIAEDFTRVPMGSFTWISFVVSSVVFGLLHGRWLAGSLAGLLFALALYQRGRLSDAVLAHVTANGLVTGYVLASQDWATWS